MRHYGNAQTQVGSIISFAGRAAGYLFSGDRRRQPRQQGDLRPRTSGAVPSKRDGRLGNRFCRRPMVSLDRHHASTISQGAADACLEKLIRPNRLGITVSTDLSTGKPLEVRQK